MDKRSFFGDVWELVALIPAGNVTTYGAIAKCLNLKAGARSVGWALNACHLAPFPVPAHRVVNRKGALSAEKNFGNIPMRELLLNEDIIFLDNGCVDLSRHFWDPETPLT